MRVVPVGMVRMRFVRMRFVRMRLVRMRLVRMRLVRMWLVGMRRRRWHGRRIRDRVGVGGVCFPGLPALTMPSLPSALPSPSPIPCVCPQPAPCAHTSACPLPPPLSGLPSSPYSHRSDLHAEFPTRAWIADHVLDAFVRVCEAQGVGEPEPVGAAAGSGVDAGRVDAVDGVEATGVGGVANEGPSPAGPPG